MNVYVIQSKSGIMINFPCECKKLVDWGSFKTNYIWNPSTCDCECNKTCKLMDI